MPVASQTLLARLTDLLEGWATRQHSIVVGAAELADSSDWVQTGRLSAAHWLAATADIELCTAREWVRIGRLLRGLPASADAFADGRLSYSKVRTLTRIATPENERELVDIALLVPAGRLSEELAAWIRQNSDAGELEAHQHRERRIHRRVQPDGMVRYTMLLPPMVAGEFDAHLTAWVTRGKSFQDASADAFPTVGQQWADAFASLVGDPARGGFAREVVLHVRGDGCTLDDGTPVGDSAVASIVPSSFVRALIHDAERRPINASGRHRFPTTRQKRVVKERDRRCVDCGRTDLLEYDHVPDFEVSRRTEVDGLEPRCSPCHRRRHRGQDR